MLNIIRVTNIFDEKMSRWQAEAGHSIAKYLPSDFRLDQGKIELNGKGISPLALTADGDTLILVDLPGPAVPLVGGLIGGAASLFASLIGYNAALGAYTFLPVAGTAFTGFTYYNLGLNIYNNFIGAKHPSLRSEIEESAIGRYTGVQTTVGAGLPLPVVLGKKRCGGNVLESYASPPYDIIPDSDDYVTTVSKTEQSEPVARALNTLIAFCWGPIQSITEIEIDGNPIEEIRGVRYETKLGTKNQRPPALFEDGGSQVTTPIGVGPITAASSPFGPYQTSTEVDTIAIHFEFTSGLIEYTNKGKIKPRDVSLTIEYREVGGGSYTTYGPFIASGAVDASKPFRVLLPELDRDYYEFRVTRNTADNSDPLIKDEFDLVSITEIRAGSYAHPGMAQLAITQIPQERQSVPRNYTALISGLNDVRMYTTPTTYTMGWTDNPAWLALHMICNHSRYYGWSMFFDYDDVEDMQDWIDAAHWCDESVDDGAGGYEKRCTFNHELQRPLSQDELSQLFYNSCGLWIVELVGRWRIVVDDDADPVFLFSEAAYVRNSMSWSFMGNHSRPSRLTASFFNESRNYEKDKLIKVDETVSVNESYIDSSPIDMSGATGIAQVTRQLIKKLNSARLIGETVKFTAGYSGSVVRAGSVFAVATKTGFVGIGNGRIQRISDNCLTIWLDSELELEASKSYEILVGHVKDPSEDPDAAQKISTEALVVSVDQTTNIITIQEPAAWEAEPKVGDVYTVGEVNLAHRLFRCVRKTLNPNYTNDIEAIEHDPDIYELDYTIDDEPPAATYFDPRIVPSAVENLTLAWRESEDSNGDVLDVIDCSWTPAEADEAIDRYDVFFRPTGAGSGWIYGGNSHVTNFSLQRDLEPSTEYAIGVVAVSQMGKKLALDDMTTSTITTS